VSISSTNESGLNLLRRSPAEGAAKSTADWKMLCVSGNGQWCPEARGPKGCLSLRYSVVKP